MAIVLVSINISLLYVGLSALVDGQYLITIDLTNLIKCISVVRCYAFVGLLLIRILSLYNIIVKARIR